MSHITEDSDYVMVRLAGTTYYTSGSGQHQPKLYTRGAGIAICRKNNSRAKSNGTQRWEVVPVKFVFGEPLSD